MTPKIAAYIDEAGEDPISGCQTVSALGIQHAVLRYGWAGKNICDISDNACQKIKSALSDNKLAPVALMSDAGLAPAHHIFQDMEKLNRAFLLAEYFGVKYIRIYCGLKSKHDVGKVIQEWMKTVTELSISTQIIPLLEVTDDQHYTQPADVAKLLADNRKWRLLYDPVQFVLKRKIDPYIKYWILLKDFAAAVDARDIKIGRGYKPIGLGDTRIAETLIDAVQKDNWIFLEPSLGRRYGQQTTKTDSFKLAYDVLKTAVSIAQI